MAKIIFYCRFGHKIKVSESLAGQKGHCPTCGTRVRAPVRRQTNQIVEDDIREAIEDVPLPAGGSRVVDNSFVGTESGIGNWLHERYEPVPPAVPAAKLANADKMDDAPVRVWDVPEAFNTATESLVKRLKDQIEQIRQEIEDKHHQLHQAENLLARVNELSLTANTRTFPEVLWADFEAVRLVMQSVAQQEERQLDEKFMEGLTKEKTSGRNE